MSRSRRLGAFAILSALREVGQSSGDRRPIAVEGARELVPLLVRDLRAGGDAAAVVETGGAGEAAVLVWIGEPDEARLRAASRAGTPIVGVTSGERLPYVLDTNLVVAGPGERMPVEKVAAAVARRLGPGGTVLAGRLPALRAAVVGGLISAGARRNALLAAAVWIPGVDMPMMTLNQIRLVLRIAHAYGEDVGTSRLPELLGVVAAGFGLRAAARRFAGMAPVVGWGARVAIAYAGTRAVGEVARRRFDFAGTRR